MTLLSCPDRTLPGSISAVPSEVPLILMAVRQAASCQGATRKCTKPFSNGNTKENFSVCLC